MDLPPDVVIRPVDATDPGDLEDAYAVARACEMADVGWSDATRESVAAQLTGPLAWREQHRLAYLGSVPVGLLATELDREGREVGLDAYVVGESARELQQALIELGMAAAVDAAQADPAASIAGVNDLHTPSAAFWQVFAAGYAQDSRYREVLQDMGFRETRRFWRMVLPLAGRPATAPPAPPGVTRRVVSGAADRRTLHALYEDSFAEHFGMTHDEPWEAWIARLEATPGSDPARWWIADLDDRPIGLCILDDSKAEMGEDYVRTLGVIAAARGRGIARWLLESAAAEAVLRGRSGLSLAVDGENTTGATALYESVGFTTREVIDVFCYPLPPAA